MNQMLLSGHELAALSHSACSRPISRPAGDLLFTCSASRATDRTESKQRLQQRHHGRTSRIGVALHFVLPFAGKSDACCSPRWLLVSSRAPVLHLFCCLSSHLLASATIISPYEHENRASRASSPLVSSSPPRRRRRSPACMWTRTTCAWCPSCERGTRWPRRRRLASPPLRLGRCVRSCARGICRKSTARLTH